MTIKVLKSADNEAIAEIEIDSVNVFRVLPFCDKVGALLTTEELKALLAKIQPTEGLNIDELENYYAQKISVCKDDNMPAGNTTPIDVPHHIALRIVLESVLQKYGTCDNLQIQIS